MSDQQQEPGVGTLMLGAIDEAKSWGRAEIVYYRSLASDRGSDAGIGIALGIAVVMLVQAALVVLLVGVVLALGPVVGPGWATAIVVVTALIVIAIVGRAALARLRLVARPLPKAGL